MTGKLKIKYIGKNTYRVIELQEDGDEVSIVNLCEGSIFECENFIKSVKA